MVKFRFSLKTREGHQVENIVIMGADLLDAERKLRQIYHHSIILHGEVLTNHDKIQGNVY